MKPLGIFPLASLCAVLCLTGISFGGDRAHPTREHSRVARLYVKLLGTSP